MEYSEQEVWIETKETVRWAVFVLKGDMMHSTKPLLNFMTI